MAAYGFGLAICLVVRGACGGFGRRRGLVTGAVVYGLSLEDDGGRMGRPDRQHDRRTDPRLRHLPDRNRPLTPTSKARPERCR